MFIQIRIHDHNWTTYILLTFKKKKSNVPSRWHLATTTSFTIIPSSYKIYQYGHHVTFIISKIISKIIRINRTSTSVYSIPYRRSIAMSRLHLQVRFEPQTPTNLLDSSRVTVELSSVRTSLGSLPRTASSSSLDNPCKPRLCFPNRAKMPLGAVKLTKKTFRAGMQAHIIATFNATKFQMNDG